MKLYNSKVAPNPRRVRIFLSEKGVSIPPVEVDLATLEHKTAEFSAINPFQVIPALELDDGTVIGESIAICRYIEELHPSRICSARRRSNGRRSRCGSAEWSGISCCRSPRSSAIPTRIWRSSRIPRSRIGPPPTAPGRCAT